MPRVRVSILVLDGVSDRGPAVLLDTLGASERTPRRKTGRGIRELRAPASA